MDKAAKAVRRSGVRLLNLGAGHSDLSVLISEVKDMRTTAKAYMTSQNSAAQYMLKWAANEENRAIQDVAAQMAELNLVWTEVQRDLCEHLKEYRQMYEMILDGEKHVSQAKNNLAACEVRETKTRKELKKAAKVLKATAQEIQMLEHRLSQAERAKDLAQLEVADRVRENEAVKLLRLKEGMIRFSEAYVDFGKKCTMLFEAQRDIAYQLPDVLGRDFDDIKYTGTGATKFYVQKAKENVRRFNRQSQSIDPSQHPQQAESHEDPPPPYSPSDYLRHPDSSLDHHFPYPESRDFPPQQQLQSANVPQPPDNIAQLPPAAARQPAPGEDIPVDQCDDLSGAMGAAKL